MTDNNLPEVVVIVGSETDLDLVKESGVTNILNHVGVSWDLSVFSAHRHLDKLIEFCRNRANKNKTLVFIAAAGMSAALPGTITAAIDNSHPVVGVPLGEGFHLDAAIKAMIDCPGGVAVAVCGVNKSGLYNAAILACQILAQSHPQISNNLAEYLQAQSKQKPHWFNVFNSK